MRYTSGIGNGQRLHVENQGLQTFVGVSTCGPGQQRSQSNAFDTGQWTQPPRLYKTQDALILQIEGDEGERFLHISGTQLRWVERPADLQDAQALDLTEPSEFSISPMRPMSPMKPLF